MKKVLDRNESSGQKPAATKWTWLQSHWMLIAVTGTLLLIGFLVYLAV